MARTVHELVSDYHAVLATRADERIALQEITDTFGQRSFGLLLLIFSAPAALPIPALGVAQVLAVPLLFFSVQMVLDRPTPWLPGWAGRRSVKRTTLIQVLRHLETWLQRVEHLVRPRLLFLTASTLERIVGLVCMACAISVAMPFPLSNTVPSMGILLMSVGLLERDGLAVTAGMAVGAAGIIIAILVMWLGVEAVRAML